MGPFKKLWLRILKMAFPQSLFNHFRSARDQMPIRGTLLKPKIKKPPEEYKNPSEAFKEHLLENSFHLTPSRRPGVRLMA
jgi:hypothetical protein